MQVESFRQLILIFALNSSNNWQLSCMHHAMLCLFLCYSFLTVWHARYSVRDVTCLDAVFIATELVKYLLYLSCMDTNTAVLCELEAYLGQHVCLKHTDICGLWFHVDRTSRNNTVTDLSCWHKRYCFWLLLCSIWFVLRSKPLLQWLRYFRPTQALVINSRILPGPAASTTLFTIH